MVLLKLITLSAGAVLKKVYVWARGRTFLPRYCRLVKLSCISSNCLQLVTFALLTQKRRIR